MINLSNVVSFLSKKFPGIVFSRESVESFVTQDKISFEAAANLVADIDSANSNGATGVEGAKVSPIDVANDDISKMVGAQAVNYYLKDVKINAMLEGIKKDDTMLYTEYVNLEKARERLLAEIAQKEENNFNTLLNEIKTTTGTDKGILDKLIDTSCCVNEYQDKLH